MAEVFRWVNHSKWPRILSASSWKRNPETSGPCRSEQLRGWREAQWLPGQFPTLQAWVLPAGYPKMPPFNLESMMMMMMMMMMILNWISLSTTWDGMRQTTICKSQDRCWDRWGSAKSSRQRHPNTKEQVVYIAADAIYTDLYSQYTACLDPKTVTASW